MDQQKKIKKRREEKEKHKRREKFVELQATAYD
jgi:hypothetical protein